MNTKNENTAVEIKPRKWYYRMMGYGGSESQYVAPYKKTGETTSDQVFSLFSVKSGTMRRHMAVPVWAAIGENGEEYEINANDLCEIGIGSIRERFDHAPDLTDERLAELKEIGRIKRENEKREEEERKRERERARHEYTRKYAYLPNRKREGKYLSTADVAANMRAELKKTFPGVKFSVRSKTFSGGDSISVSWYDGPTRKKVQEVTAKYEHSHADITGDYWDYEPNPFNDVFGGAKFVHETREISEETASIIYADATGNSKEDWDRRGSIYEIFAKTEIPVGATVTGLDVRDGQEILTFHVPEKKTERKAASLDAPVSPEGVTVTIAYNKAKNGVEIRFTSKPDASILSDLKAHGWRWSRFSGCWYNRDTETVREHAQEIAARCA